MSPLNYGPLVGRLLTAAHKGMERLGDFDASDLVGYYQGVVCINGNIHDFMG